ncbi:restriction endonuclease [Aliifodinibius salipaludis]|uniref:site-specific DNA-methyltransferase (adenine-specific) n=1 Tax=Fodinibius salipaludis TaxID=2032627 RepID=A0A2A2G9N3_9BACT|nr:BREX-1 system adenine-specific DNA-methyltransferase PglX [Aliifodinibius salipaludis]PAU93714.1 restriction endonuclease [Aliifodinibius salipaludis]
MKLAEHVQHIKGVTYQSFDNLFARLGIRAKELAGQDLIPNQQLSKRAKILELIDNHKEEKDDYAGARERALEELTFTLFNRIAAVKVMEAKTLFPEIITKRPENGDRSFQHKAWLEQNPDMRSEELEGLREFIKHAFNNLGEELALYHKSYPYALLPDTIDLNDIIEAFNAVEKDKDIEDRIWASDDVLGWLYESYNNDKKEAFKEDGGKTEYDKVSLQSQVYTPRWVVEFLVNNSLGKLYLEMYPTSDIKNRKKIANAPKEQLREPKPLHEVTLVDPALGSGNFLLYAFDLFYELYMDQIDFFGADYEEEDIPKLIIENNLFGIDLDDRAVQLAQLGLYIKAKGKNRNTPIPSFHVVSSDFYLPDFETVRPLFEDGGGLESGVTDLLKEIWDDLQNAHKFGSLLKIEDRVNRRLEKFKEEPMDLFVQEEMAKYGEFEEKFFPRIRKAVKQHANGSTTAFVKEKTLDALTYLEVITQKYDVAVANPPYTDSSDFGPDLKKFIEDNYKEPQKFHTNLYAAFIKRCSELAKTNGKIAQIHPLTFMYISSFEDVRKYILEQLYIDLMVEFGLGGVFLTTKVDVDVVGYVLDKEPKGTYSFFMNLKSYKGVSRKKEIFLDAYDDLGNGVKNSHNYKLRQEKLKEIEGYPFIYWISDGFRQKFREKTLQHFYKVAQGLATANNDRFLRFWWEVDQSKISNDYYEDQKKWVPYAKGGPYQKWFGNDWLVVNWAKDGKEIKNMTDEDGNQRSRPQNKEFYFREGITYSASGSKGVSFRHLEENHIFDVGGSSIFPLKENDISYTLALLNSSLAFYAANCLNPTVNTQVGDLKRVPFVKPSSNLESKVVKLTENNIAINKEVLSYNLTEKNYNGSPIMEFSNKKDLKDRIKAFISYKNKLFTIQLLSEAVIDELIFKIYDLSEQDIEQVLQSEGKNVSDYPLLPEALESFTDSVKDSKFITYELKEKLNRLKVDESIEKKESKISKDLSKLYQSGSSLESFCIKNEINPINVWFWFKKNNVLPGSQTEKIALDFLIEHVSEILMKDQDGIIPLVRHAGEDTLINRLENHMRNKGLSNTQISQLDILLNDSINNYLKNDFFSDLSDNLNLFRHLPKTPFIWHLSSGPHKGFECYLSIYKWSRDNLHSLKSVYIEKRERALKNRLTDLGDRSDAASQNERDTIQKQLEEIEEFKEKIDDLIASGYDPILDDGVGKNIAPLQKRGLIPYDVLTKSQLKKYLNADW